LSSPCILHILLFPFFFFNDTATPEIYTLSLHDALPIFSHDLEDVAGARRARSIVGERAPRRGRSADAAMVKGDPSHRRRGDRRRSEEHTSELQSLRHLVCRLLLEKKKKKKATNMTISDI